MTAVSRLRIAVVAGGPSSEAEVSRTSARSVGEALAAVGHTPQIVELAADLCDRLKSVRPDVVFPVTHGPLGEDGCLQGLLEVLGLPYVGSGVLASALGADKPQAKRVLAQAGVPVPEGQRFDTGSMNPDDAHRLRGELGGAVVVKPASGGSAIGVTRIGRDDDRTKFERALFGAAAVDRVVLVERWLEGLEVTCGVLELDDGPRALPPTLIHAHAADWYDFTSRYATGGSRHECPAPFSEALTHRIQELARAAFSALGARDLSRVDFVAGPPDRATVLEVNTLPGMTKTSLFPEAAAVSGVPFVELCDRLARRAASRAARSTPAAVPMPG